MTNPIFNTLLILHPEYKYTLLKGVLTKEINRKKVMQIIADHFNITTAELLSSDTKDKYCTPRHYGLYLYLQYTDFNICKIAGLFGYDNRKIVYHAATKISGFIQIDEQH